ncbi:MAG: phosphotransferase, partial [Bacteroidaceae bacterium]|nr:phosphotransferase [Bacteroidaceae bacterium]
MNEQTLIELFGGNAQIQALPGAGSNRKYFRLSDNSRSAIGVIGTSLAENEAFVTMSQHFRNKGLPMPEIYSVGSDRMAYLQEDLGDTALYDLIAKNDPSYPLYLEKAVRWLPRIQFEGAEGLDFSVCYPISDFNHRAISWDLNYFKYCFLKATGIEFDESRLEDDFERLGSDLLSLDSHTFMYRDFQSRNIMIKDNDV